SPWCSSGGCSASAVRRASGRTCPATPRAGGTDLLPRAAEHVEARGPRGGLYRRFAGASPARARLAPRGIVVARQEHRLDAGEAQRPRDGSGIAPARLAGEVEQRDRACREVVLREPLDGDGGAVRERE